ncbi:dephospho-CoA kinase [Bacillus thermotolerans]|uniref:Dephospho-CoA kinase n=1 Tax=Bacillus thermotolerans TaxID=1221996 RepID=A0A0F5IDR5_BACTR|nr:dephospho-CoA kinase [Bacillus thermotolerans]KKB43317.1 Dephospho-CoA kinase [Bacillus thermotolerans]
MAVIIGLTGSIASGKSTVSRLLQELGYTIVDADVAARKVVEPGQPALQQIAEAFGEGILLPDGSLDRAKLGERIFNNEEERKKLNSIIHPAVRQFMKDEKEAAIEAGKQTIIMDIPLLYESKLTWMVGKVIVVYVDKDTQLQRLMARNQLDEDAAKARIASQLPLAEKAAQADAVIDNNGTIEETKEQLLRILRDWQLTP